ncbi:hypothetical protein [Methylorubrum sp. POS3]|uniref:hypothetical protein n=1 Tax=Methylorubrum sp. POS3 TaxID=2998492 RepID=UPI00372ACC04
MNDDAIRQVVAAILTTASLKSDDPPHSTVVVNKFISILENLADKNEQIDAALGKTKPTSMQDLL